MNQTVVAKDLLRGFPKLARSARGVTHLLSYFKQVDSRTYQSYGSIIEYCAEKYANNVLIKFDDVRITYREFNEAANRIAHYLQHQNVNQGDVVALFMENRPEYLIAMAAIAKTGAIAALINSAQRDQVLVHSINLVSPKLIIVGEELIAAIEEVKQELTVCRLPLIVPDSSAEASPGFSPEQGKNLTSESEVMPAHNLLTTRMIRKSDPCCYIYTSGTTGLPKASIQSNEKLVKSFVAGLIIDPMRQDDTFYSCLPLYHATALLVCWMRTIATGSAFALRRKFSATEFWSDIQRYDATVFGYVGELCRYLLNQTPSPQERNHSVRMMLGNGLRPDLWGEFKQRFGIDEVKEFYGASEGNVICFNLFNVDNTVGVVIGSYALVQFDRETEEPIRGAKGFYQRVAKGEPGLLLGRITRATPFDGYTDKQKNESKILKDVFRKGDRWFNTGDVVKNIGYRHLQFVDRTGDTFRWKGENVSTGEVEKIVNQYPGVKEAVAYGVEIPHTNGRAGMLAVTIEDGCDLGVEEFVEMLSRKLPKYAIPVFIRVTESLESTGTFKYQKGKLKKQGYDLNEVDEPIKVLLPGSKAYQDLTEEICKGIDANEYRF